MTYRFRVELVDVSNPEVWRIIDVPSTFTFFRLNQVIQIAFGWFNLHHWEFVESEDMWEKRAFRIAVPTPFDGEYEEKTLNAKRTRISSIFNDYEAFTYIYDFGDRWRHRIILEDVLPDNAEAAVCIKGSGATPPEDCGGTGGYELMKKSFAEKDDEVRSYRGWLGLKSSENWNPKAFTRTELRAINAALIQIMGWD